MRNGSSSRSSGWMSRYIRRPLLGGFAAMPNADRPNRASACRPAGPAVAVGAPAMRPTALPGSGGKPVHQVFGPSTDPCHPAEFVHVMVHTSRVNPDVDVAARPAGRPRAVRLQDLAHAF